MHEGVTPCAIVDRQRCAYNARGIDAIRTVYAARFRASPNLHYDIKCRIELGRFVADHELVTGIGEGVLEVVAIYEVHDALIHSLRFIER